MAYLGEDVKKLGFGLMRLPRVAGTETDEIDVEQVKDMVDAFMEAGFTYFDTAWAYNGSEEAICEALVKRYPRDSYTLATKNAAWIHCKTVRRRSRSSMCLWSAQARATLISICCTIWASTGPIISTTGICGPL